MSLDRCLVYCYVFLLGVGENGLSVESMISESSSTFPSPYILPLLLSLLLLLLLLSLLQGDQ